MSVAGVTLATRTALAAAITTSGIECLKYANWDMRNTQAGLGVPRWELVDGHDQKYGIRAIIFPVEVYQNVDSQTDAAGGYQDTNFEAIIDALGSNRTLGNTVPTSDVVSDPTLTYYRTGSAQLYSVLSFDVRVTVFSNAG